MTVQETRAERQRALRALLQHPLLSAAGSFAEEFGLVRRHREWLADWLNRYPGWRLQIESEFARLRKTPGDITDCTRPAVEPREETPFTRRRYALLCLALAALERSDRQTALGRLAEDIENLVVTDPLLQSAGFRFDLLNYDHRRDLVHVARFLVDRGILVKVHGDELQYLNADGGDALYNIRRPLLTAALNVRRGPSTISNSTLDARISKMIEEPLPDNEDGRHRRIRTMLVRRLLDDPVVYYNDLDPESLAYLHRQRGLLLSQIQEATGLHPEVRKEGIAMTDSGGDLTDFALPESGTAGHLALLLAEHLANHARQDRDATIGMTSLVRRTAELIREHRTRWNREASLPSAEINMTRETLARLEALRLVRRNEDGVIPMPAIARYAVKDVQ